MFLSNLLPFLISIVILPTFTVSHPSQSPTQSPPILCTSAQSPAYQSLIAKNSAQFHKNFNKPNDVGKKANGLLASVSIDWVSNNINTIGRKSFVSGLEAFDAPFPNLQIKDVLHLNDGNLACIFYYFQGFQNGDYNGHPATGNKIEAANGELLLFDAQGLLYRLISVNELDRIENEVTGRITIDEFQNFSLIENPQTSPAFRAKIKNAAAQFNTLFNARDFNGIAKLATTDVKINADNVLSSGRDELVKHFKMYESSFPDMLAQDEYLLSDGSYAAIEFVWQGTRNGSFMASNGTVVNGDGKSYRVRGFRWFRFDGEGAVEMMWEVRNNDDFLTQVQG